MKIFLYFWFLFGMLFKVYAYIPNSEIILSRWVQNQGTRNYKISKEVTFLDRSSLKGTLTFKEEWWRLSTRLFVNVTKNSKTVFSFSYKNSTKSWRNAKNKRVSQRKNYIENYFFLKPEPPSWISSIEDIKLERALGVINYVFHLNDKSPTLWIEQDEFVLRKIKLKKNFWLMAEDYQMYPRQLLFPRKRTFLSPKMRVEIKVLGVRLLSSQENIPTRLKSASFQEDNELVKQFYYQLR